MTGIPCRRPIGAFVALLSRLSALPLLGHALAHAATFTVTHTGDSGDGSLRWAIDQSNGRPGTDRITFNIPGPGPHFIEPLNQLPDITDTADIDGATQPGYAGTPRIVVSGARVGHTIFYHPAGIIVRANDCVIRALCIQNFVGAGRVDHVNEGGIGLRIHGNRNVVIGCFIGTSPDGLSRAGNGYGVGLFGSDNHVGSTTVPGGRNVISGNDLTQVHIIRDTFNNKIRNNLIGMNAAGTANITPPSRWRNNADDVGQPYYYPAVESAGIWSWINTGTVIGGREPGEANYISGVMTGIVLGGGSQATVWGNHIGLSPDGNPLPLVTGIVVCNATIFTAWDSWFGPFADRYPAFNHTVGGTIPAEGNQIGNCQENAIVVEGWELAANPARVLDVYVAGNRIGLTATGAPAPVGGSAVFIREARNVTVERNTFAHCTHGVTVAGYDDRTEHVANAEIVGNRTEASAGSAIRFEQWTIRRPSPGSIVESYRPQRTLRFANPPADFLDADVGPNHFQNTPVVEFATGLPNGRVRVDGFVRGEPGRTYRAEIFASVAPSAGAARGEIPAGTQSGILTDATGIARFSIESSVIPARSWITATATRLDGRGPSPATSTMSDAILAPGSGRFAFAGGTLVTPEGTGITVTIRRTGSSLGSASVRVVVDPDASNAGPLDYLLNGLDAQGRIEFGSGVSERTLVLFPTRDGIDELTTELVALRLAEPSPGSTADNSLRLVGITDSDPNPTISVPSVSVFEGNTGITQMVFDVQISHPSERLMWMIPSFDRGTTDLADTSGWLFTYVDDTHFRFEVFVLGDSAFEPDESFQVHFMGGLTPNGVSGEDRIVSPTVTGTIRNDDAPPKQSVFFVAGSIVVSEGDGEVWASVQRSDSSGQARVKVLTESRTATRGRDFDAPNEAVTLEFPEGHAGPIAFRIGLIEDLLDEDDESFVLRLESPSWSDGEMGVGEVGSFIVHVKDNDDEPVLSLSGESWLEGHAGSASQTITFQLSAPSDREVQLQYASRHVSTDDADITPITGTLTFPPGTVKAVIPVAIRGDITWEPDETFVLDVISALNASVVPSTPIFVIRNDDSDSPVLAFTPDSASVLESDGVLRVTVTRTGRLDVAAPFKLSFGPGTTIDPGVEVTGVGSFEMAAGTTEMNVGLGLVDDLVDEEHEVVDLVLSAVSPTTLTGTTTARVAVVDDDAPPIARLEDFVVIESDTPGEYPIRARVHLSQPSGRSIRLVGKLANGTAVQGADFFAELVEVSIPPGESSADVPMRFLADADAEGVEFASFHWTEATHATLPGAAANIRIAPLSITSLEIVDGHVRLVFPTGTYQNWRVQKATDLKPSAWTNASGLQPGAGAPLRWEDPEPVGEGVRFYRIQLH